MLASAPMIQRARATTRANQRGTGSAERLIGVSAFARKFWMITSCIAPVASASSLRANSESTISWWFSPIPTRIPVVNGTFCRPAASMVATRRAGSLVGEL